MSYPNSLHWWTDNVLPLVYDESLTYYEVLNKIVTYVNGITQDTQELTALVNELKEIVENADLDDIPEVLAKMAVIDTRLDGTDFAIRQLEGEINDLRTSVSNVTNNVNNLSQDNTQNKTDIADLKTDNTQNKNDIADLKTDNTQNKNNILELNSEISNLSYKRTINNRKFIHIKDAANLQAVNVVGDIAATKITQCGKNLFYPSGVRVNNRYYKGDGSLGSSNSWYVSELISVFPETTYTLTGVNSGSAMAAIRFFDGGQSAIGNGVTYNGTDKNTFTTPQDCYYISFSILKTVDRPQLEIGSIATSYEAPNFATHTLTGGAPSSSITMLEGINNLWSDYGVISITYYVSPSIAATIGLNQPGKYCAVYKFGGDGNDWCFVRTPSDYDPTRSKPYPFVICNHGNTWVMDGTERYANWTKRTMYVPLDDPDYIANPTQYNGTTDESLWYSNPTIEALLTAGYIVCGCENYNDNLYGNTECRNACVDFYYHMITTYNVEDRCYMIGASNGALTTLNAAYLLQGSVKAMILQYPVTCLLNQYNSNSSQQAAIRRAYGISSSNPTQAMLENAFRTHDPLTTDVVSGTKVGVIPPIKFWYSEDDAVAKYQQNTIALYNLLDASGKVVEKVQVSGAHGDYSHFDPAATVAWFDAN